MIEVSGVRSSWLIVAMKSLLSSSKCVSSSFARRSSSLYCMFLITRANWPQSETRICTLVSIGGSLRR